MLADPSKPEVELPSPSLAAADDTRNLCRVRSVAVFSLCSRDLLSTAHRSQGEQATAATLFSYWLSDYGKGVEEGGGSRYRRSSLLFTCNREIINNEVLQYYYRGVPLSFMFPVVPSSLLFRTKSRCRVQNASLQCVGNTRVSFPLFRFIITPSLSTFNLEAELIFQS